MGKNINRHEQVLHPLVGPMVLMRPDHGLSLRANRQRQHQTQAVVTGTSTHPELR